MDYELLENKNLKIGEKAPDFCIMTTMGEVKLNDYEGKWLILFSHPADFTSVCTTEMIAFANAYDFFKELNAELLGLSVDSNSSHLAWVYDMFLKTGIKIPFPIIEDKNGILARKYGMISKDISNYETVRNVYIIDPNGIVRVILSYPMNIGRFIPEILRTLKALQTSEQEKLLMPANWMSGQPGIIPPPKTYQELEQRLEYMKENNKGISWYLNFKEI